MRMTLRRLREAKGWKLNTAAIIFGIKSEQLKAYEEYRDVPTFKELIKMLKLMGYYFDEVPFIIFRDIEAHYKPSKGDKLWINLIISKA